MAAILSQSQCVIFILLYWDFECHMVNWSAHTKKSSTWRLNGKDNHRFIKAWVSWGMLQLYHRSSAFASWSGICTEPSFVITVHKENIGHHYIDVIMSAIAFQIIEVSSVFRTVSSGADHRKHQSPVPQAFVRGIHRWPVISPHKGPVPGKTFPFDYVVMDSAISILTLKIKCVIYVFLAVISDHLWAIQNNVIPKHFTALRVFRYVKSRTCKIKNV